MRSHGRSGEGFRGCTMVPSAYRAHGCQDPGATAGVPASGAVTPSPADFEVDGPVTRSASRSQSAATVAVSRRAVQRCEIDIKPLGIGALRTDGRASFPRSTLYLEVDNQPPIGSCRVFARRERDPVTALAPAGVVAKEPSCTLSGNTKNQVKEQRLGQLRPPEPGQRLLPAQLEGAGEYANRCKALQLDLGEGSGPRTARFAFTK